MDENDEDALFFQHWGEHRQHYFEGLSVLIIAVYAVCAVSLLGFVLITPYQPFWTPFVLFGILMTLLCGAAYTLLERPALENMEEGVECPDISEEQSNEGE